MTRNVKDSIMPSVCNCIGKCFCVVVVCIENGSKAVLVCELCVYVCESCDGNKQVTPKALLLGST